MACKLSEGSCALLQLKREFEDEEAACKAAMEAVEDGDPAACRRPQPAALFPPAGRQHMFKPPPERETHDITKPMSAKEALRAHINRCCTGQASALCCSHSCETAGRGGVRASIVLE